MEAHSRVVSHYILALIAIHLIVVHSSGDTGVSVSLVLQGKSPFKVFYQTKRDREPARELTHVFHGSRGEVTLQPDRFDSPRLDSLTLLTPYTGAGAIPIPFF